MSKHRLKGRRPSPRTNCAQRRTPRHRRRTGSTAVVRISAGVLAVACAVLLAVGDPTVRPPDEVYPVPAAVTADAPAPPPPVFRCGPPDVEELAVRPAPVARSTSSRRVVKAAPKPVARKADKTQGSDEKDGDER